MNDVLSSIKTIILRDLDKLEKEISSYRDEESIWKTGGEIINPAGNLCLHLCGNLQHYLGAVLGKSGYVRNRPNEFSLKGLKREALIAEIARTKAAVEKTFPMIDPAGLTNNYPEKVFDYPMTTLYFLIHLSAHLEYHLGQINYHRRLLSV